MTPPLQLQEHDGPGPRNESHHALTVEARAAAKPRHPDGAVYAAAARACLPRWMWMLGPAPWLADPLPRGRRREQAPIALLRRQSATLGIALLAIDDTDTSRVELLSEYVRCSLIRWQMSLRNDGAPRAKTGRSSPWHAAVAACVTQLLLDRPRFRTVALTQDLARYLHWLSKRHEHSAWIEASAASALIDGADIVGDESLLRRARHRLHRLLAHQDSEGWFPEHGGADPGRLALTLDLLARVRDRADCPQIHDAIRRALAFLVRVVRPDGGVGACVGTCGTGFLSPYGIEQLAGDYRDAASLALLCRRRYARIDASRLQGWSDELCAVLGARLAAAGLVANASLPAEIEDPSAWRGVSHFPGSGLSVFSMDGYHAVVSGRKGGAIQVHWRADEWNLEDAGPTALIGQTTRTSGRFDRRTQIEVSSSSMTCRGTLRPTVRVRRRLWSRLKRLFARRRVGRWLRARHHTPQSVPPVAHRWHAAAKRFQREIKFGDDWIVIHDDVACRGRFAAVVCHTGDGASRNPWSERNLDDATTHPPIFLEGYKQLSLTRVYRTGAMLEFRILPDPEGTAPEAGASEE